MDELPEVYWEMYVEDGTLKLDDNAGHNAEKAITAEFGFFEGYDLFGCWFKFRTLTIKGLARITKDSREARWLFDVKYDEAESDFKQEHARPTF